jgi:hypothetical protein
MHHTLNFFSNIFADLAFVKKCLKFNKSKRFGEFAWYILGTLDFCVMQESTATGTQ